MSELEADLNAFLFGEDFVPDEPPPTPEDAIGADRLLARVRHFEAQAAEINAIADARIAEFTAWRDDRLYGVERSIAFHARSLEIWMRAEHTAKGTKTKKLPAGDLMVRPRQPKLVVVPGQEHTLELWIRRGRRWRWLRPKFELVKSTAADDVKAGAKAVKGPTDPEPGYEWREACDASGEVVPGLLILEPVERKFSYKTNTEEQDR